MSAPGGGAAKADAAISRQKLMNRFLTMPVFPAEFATRPHTGSCAKGQLRSLVQILNCSKVRRVMPDSALCFGRFRLDLAPCQLLLGERPLQLGDRALQVLCVLAGAKGALVSKDELMARVWAGQVVEENNLQVQISALRKTLDPDGTGESWIVTVPGRGYRLLGVGNGPPAEPAPAHHSNLPQLANALIGRERDVAEIEALLSKHRLVTLAGAPGVGKTSLSLQVGADLLARFPDGARFIELAQLDRPQMFSEAVAAVFGLPVQEERSATEAVAAFLRSRRVLLIL